MLALCLVGGGAFMYCGDVGQPVVPGCSDSENFVTLTIDPVAVP